MRISVKDTRQSEMELVKLLLDFVIVSATLAKRLICVKKNREVQNNEFDGKFNEDCY